jgi:hypothetical protein
MCDRISYRRGKRGLLTDVHTDTPILQVRKGDEWYFMIHAIKEDLMEVEFRNRNEEDKVFSVVCGWFGMDQSKLEFQAVRKYPLIEVIPLVIGESMGWGITTIPCYGTATLEEWEKIANQYKSV